MNLYADAAIGLDLRTTNGFNAFLYRLGPGVEFFLSELPNLGFMLEFGFWGEVPGRNIEPPNSTTYFGTTTPDLFGAVGVHYYF